MASIAVIGAGAMGCYYGGRLALAGHNVRFLMRRDLEAVRANGLKVHSADGDFRLEGVNAFASPAEIGVTDWVICALKTTALDDAPALIAPCVGPGTRVVAMMNGLGIEERLAAHFGRERLFGAMGFTCINRGAPGVIHHLRYGRLTVGHMGDDAAEVECLAGLLRGAALDTVIAPSLLHARWEKLCWNVPFNGLSVAGGGIGTAAICSDPALRETAERAMREVAAAGNAGLAADGQAARIEPDEIVARLFALTDTMGDYRTSMAIDYVLGRPLEVETILAEPWRRAQALGVPAATLGTIDALVHAADLRRRGLLPVISEAEAGNGEGG